MDIDTHTKGETSLSMQTFTNKLMKTFSIPTWPYPITTPGRTDVKIKKGEEPEPNTTYRSKVGGLNWLSMCVRYDIVYATKEFSRVLAEPTKTAKQSSTGHCNTLTKLATHAYNTNAQRCSTFHPHSHERNPQTWPILTLLTIASPMVFLNKTKVGKWFKVQPSGPFGKAGGSRQSATKCRKKIGFFRPFPGFFIMHLKGLYFLPLADS